MERVMLLMSMSREWPFRAHDLAFADAMEDRVEVLNGGVEIISGGKRHGGLL
jgi:hypothetical protein